MMRDRVPAVAVDERSAAYHRTPESARRLRPRIHFGLGRSATTRLLPAATCGVLIALPWLDERLFPTAWVGVIVLLLVSHESPAYFAFRLWLVAGLATMGTGFHWLPAVAARVLDVSLASGAMVALCAITWDAFRFGVFGWIIARWKPDRRIAVLVIPAAWVALEWIWPHVFPWRIGQTQLGWLPFCQIVEATGVYGVSFLLMGGSAAIAQWMWTRRHSSDRSARRTAGIQLVIISAAILVCVAWGTWRIDSINRLGEASPQLRVAIIQPGARENLLPTLRRLTYDLNEDVDLVVWGEASVGCFPADLTTFRSAARNVASTDTMDPAPCPGLDLPLLCGGATSEVGAVANEPLLNTAFLVDRNEAILGRYHKRALMPWGEYAVGQQWLPGMRNLLGDGASWRPGASAAPLCLPQKGRLGVLICYEDVQATTAREVVLEGADVFVNLNNLNAFGRTAALKQHQHLARFRAIENRRFLVRCGITGSSAVVSATGRVERQLPTNERATAVVDVPILESTSPYTRLGDVFALACTSLCLVQLCIQSIAGLTERTVVLLREAHTTHNS